MSYAVELVRLPHVLHMLKYTHTHTCTHIHIGKTLRDETILESVDAGLLQRFHFVPGNIIAHFGSPDPAMKHKVTVLLQEYVLPKNVTCLQNNVKEGHSPATDKDTVYSQKV